jgi:hypothetical protein
MVDLEDARYTLFQLSASLIQAIRCCVNLSELESVNFEICNGHCENHTRVVMILIADCATICRIEEVKEEIQRHEKASPRKNGIRGTVATITLFTGCEAISMPE